MDSLSQLSWVKVKGARLCTPKSTNQWVQAEGNSWGGNNFWVFRSQSSWYLEKCMCWSWRENWAMNWNIHYCHSLGDSDPLTSDTKYTPHLRAVTPEFKFFSSSRKIYNKVSGRNYSFLYSWSGDHSWYSLFSSSTTIVDSFLWKE